MTLQSSRYHDTQAPDRASSALLFEPVRLLKGAPFGVLRVPVEYGARRPAATTTSRSPSWTRGQPAVTSHNPRILKARVVGDHLVNGTPPPYAWAIGTTERTALRS